MANITIYSGLGWCLSDLNVEPSVAVMSAMDCWTNCLADYAETVATDYYPDTSLCFCQARSPLRRRPRHVRLSQDACSCLVESDDSELAVVAGFELPAGCSDSDDVDDADTLDPSLRLEADVGWCNSDLNMEPSVAVTSAQTCWTACQDEYDSVVAIDYYPSQDICYCQDSCPCLFEADDVELVVEADFTLPDLCSDEDDEGSGGNSNSSTNCEDNATWFAFGDPTLNCSWVAEDLDRCAEVANDDSWAYLACPETCDACVDECDDPFPDSATWHIKGAPEKDCAWVADYAERCRRLGDDGTWAWQACPFSCRTCEYSDGGCDDDDEWRSAESSDDDVEDCYWVAEAKGNRCKTLGADGFGRAFEACRRACHACKFRLTGTCEDSETFFKMGDSTRTCDAWVGEITALVSNRCAAKGNDNEWAYDECPLTCNTC